jgi:hypothetical protein
MGERRKRVGEEPNHTTARMPGPLQIIQYSLLQAVENWLGMGKSLTFFTVYAILSESSRTETHKWLQDTFFND